MMIIEPKVELWKQEDPIEHVAKCARVCYGSPVEGKSTVQDLYDRLLKAKHNSMFRHRSEYAIIPDTPYNREVISPFNNCPYVNIIYPTPILADRIDDKIYIATNHNFMIDYRDYAIWNIITCHQVTPDEFANTEVGWNMMRYTFRITTQISTSRELNRVSPNAIAERSTRYVHENGTIVRPHWITEEDANIWNKEDTPENEHLPNVSNELVQHYLLACNIQFTAYKALLDKGLKRQDARGVLPLDTATEVVYTYSIDEWRHVIELRSDRRAHPNAQIIANMIKKELEGLGYDFE